MAELHADVWRDVLTPTVFLERTQRVFPERIGVIHGDGAWSWTRFAAEVGRLAGALQRAGVARGDRVAVLLHNTPVHLAAHFAMPLLGAPLVTVNVRLAPAEIAYILEHSGAKGLLVDPELAPPLDDVLPGIATLERVVEVADTGVPARAGRESYAALVEGAPVLPLRSECEDEDAILSINYTSGTTGMPKGVMYTHRGATLNVLGQLGTHGLDKGSTFLWTLPMFHCNGWCMPWAVTGAGGRHVGLRGIDPPQIFALRLQVPEPAIGLLLAVALAGLARRSR